MRFKVIRTERTTLSLEINKNAEVIVHSPLYATDRKINEFVAANKAWINKNVQKQRELKKYYKSISAEDIENLKTAAKEYLPLLTERYAQIMNLHPTGVRITSAKNRFGSCNGKNSICYSYRLMLYDIKAIEYVVVHELAHIRYKDHGKDFYKLIENYLPDYKERVLLLKEVPTGTYSDYL